VRRLLAAVGRWWRTPEPKRVDRERMYVWVHVGLLCVGLGIFARPEVGLLAVLSVVENRALAVSIITGSALALTGAAMGSRWFLPRAAADLRLAYGCGIGGQCAVVFSLVYYAVVITSHSDLIGTMAGALSIMIGAACTQITAVAVKEFFRSWRLINKAGH
jgi:hypothetical protein